MELGINVTPSEDFLYVISYTDMTATLTPLDIGS